MVWGSIASAAAGAAVGGAFDIAGGYLSRPDLSQRDLMYTQRDIWREMMRDRHRLNREGLIRARLNPMLAFSQAPPGPQAGAAPQPFKDPLGEGVSRAGSSAREGFLMYHRMQQIKAQTEQQKASAVQQKAAAKMLTAQAVTEARRPGLISQQTLQAGSSYQLQRQQVFGQIIENRIKMWNVTVAQKEAAKAAVQLGLWRAADSVVRPILQGLGFTVSQVKELLRQFRRLREGFEQYDFGEVPEPQGNSSAFDQFMRRWRARIFE